VIHTWSSESSPVLKVSASGSSASVSAGSTGRGVVRVEYETKDGEKVEAEKAGSVVELRSVGPVPQIALIDDRGNSLPPVSAAIPRPSGRIVPAACGCPGSGAPGGPRRVSVRTSATRRRQDSRYARPGRGSTISPGPGGPVRFTEARESSRLRVAGLRESGRTVNEEL